MKAIKIVGIALIALVVALYSLGSSMPEPDKATNSSTLSDAKAAINMELNNPELSELHYLVSENVVCGLVNHDNSEIGKGPFAYSHKLGLSVAKVWGRNEPEKINKLYGCSFLPIAYVDEWKSPFWGAKRGDIYEP